MLLPRRPVYRARRAGRARGRRRGVRSGPGVRTWATRSPSLPGADADGSTLAGAAGRRLRRRAARRHGRCAAHGGRRAGGPPDAGCGTASSSTSGPGATPTASADNVRRLHLTGVQFYDWAYRHADLLGGGEEYADALGQPVSLDTVRALIDAAHVAGARRARLRRGLRGRQRRVADVAARRPADAPTGAPYGLGDFLCLVDPAAPDWSAHFARRPRGGRATVGFDGFHLDQYGYPKRAVRADGASSTSPSRFATLIEQVAPDAARRAPGLQQRQRLPDLAYRRRAAGRDLHRGLAAARHPRTPRPTRRAGPRARRPTDLRSSPPTSTSTTRTRPTIADRSTALTMATLFSHGATQLLAGEADRLLVDPYYVRNHAVAPSTLAMLARWYDFLVEHGELLLDPRVGRRHRVLRRRLQRRPRRGIRRPCDQRAGTARRHLAPDRPDRRRSGRASDQPARPVGHPVGRARAAARSDSGPGVVRVRRVGSVLPRIQVADPDRAARLVDLPVSVEGDDAVASLPELGWWQVLRIDLAPERARRGRSRCRRGRDEPASRVRRGHRRRASGRRRRAVVEVGRRLPDLPAQLRRLQRRRHRRPARHHRASSTTSPRWASTSSGSPRSTPPRRTTTATTSATTRAIDPAFGTLDGLWTS